MAATVAGALKTSSSKTLRAVCIIGQLKNPSWATRLKGALTITSTTCLTGLRNALAIGRCLWKKPTLAMKVTGIARNIGGENTHGQRTTNFEQRGRLNTKKNDFTEIHPCSAFQEMELQVHD